jgi:hypothetical protein
VKAESLFSRSELAQHQRDLIDAYKIAESCKDCGYDKNPRALQFDHRPGNDKRQNIADMPGRYSTQAILLEIIKCDVRCSNCHAVITYERRSV